MASPNLESALLLCASLPGGPKSPQIYDKNKNNNERLILRRIPLGHIDLNYGYLVYGLSWRVLGKYLVDLSVFTTPAGRRMLADGLCSRKSWDFHVRDVGVSALRALLVAYARAAAASSGPQTVITVSGWLAWLRRDHGDETTNSIVTLVLDVFPGLLAIRAAGRLSRYAAAPNDSARGWTCYKVGMFLLQPYAFSRNMHNYARRMTRAAGDMELRRVPNTCVTRDARSRPPYPGPKPQSQT